MLSGETQDLLIGLERIQRDRGSLTLAQTKLEVAESFRALEKLGHMVMDNA